MILPLSVAPTELSHLVLIIIDQFFTVDGKNAIMDKEI